MKHFLLFCASLSAIFCACSQTTDKRMPIAIVTPVTHPSLEKIEQGFIETLEQLHPGLYRFQTYNAQGNKNLMRSEIEEISHQNFGLVLTIGSSATQMVKETFNKKNISMPIVFTAVSDPIGLQIIPAEINPGGNVTGVKEITDFKSELNILLQFKPNIKTILVAYDPTIPGLIQDEKELASLLKSEQIQLILVEIFQTNEIKAKVSPFIGQADAVVVLKDNTVVAGLDALVKLCNLQHIPLMASELDSPERGAALGYGVHERDFGMEAAKKAELILMQNIQPGNIPVSSVPNFSLQINHQAAKIQGIE